MIPDYLQTPGTGAAPDLDRVVAETTEAIERDPSDAQAYFRRGNAYSNAGDYARAIEDMSRVIELDPESSMAHNNRGVAYLCTGDPSRRSVIPPAQSSWSGSRPAL